MATKYMHTISGEPAYWSGEQIVYGGRTRNSKAIPLVDSLKTIRFQQLLTKQYRTKNGFDYDMSRYGYVRVRCE
jgi:hypothetical protein